MSAELSFTRQAGASVPRGEAGAPPAVSVERSPAEALGAVRRAPSVSAPPTPRIGEELALVLAVPDAAESSVPEDGIVLDAERLVVYHLALELHAFAASKVPTLSRVLKDQLERASLSVVLNIAEGGGRRSRKDKARHYTYARGSATEVAACFDVLKIRKLAPACECARGRSLAIRVVQMLTKLCASLQSTEEATV